MTTMQNGYRMAWSPAQPKPQGQAQAELSQAAPPTPFLESPVLASITDVVVGTAAGFYAWGLGMQKNKWSTLMWVISAANFMKLLHDLGRIEERS
jgi:hypothetical protein